MPYGIPPEVYIIYVHTYIHIHTLTNTQIHTHTLTHTHTYTHTHTHTYIHTYTHTHTHIHTHTHTFWIAIMQPIKWTNPTGSTGLEIIQPMRYGNSTVVILPTSLTQPTLPITSTSVGSLKVNLTIQMVTGRNSDLVSAH